MPRQTQSFVRKCDSSKCQHHDKQVNRFQLKLLYTDKRYDITLITAVESPPTLTVSCIIDDTIRLLYLSDISAEQVILSGFTRGKEFYPLDIESNKQTLEEIGITTRCILHFKPTLHADPPKRCQLRIISPDEDQEVLMSWYRATTTLNMLLEFVIDRFSLQFIDRQRIHLHTLFEELIWREEGDFRLSMLEINDRMAVYVKIDPPLSPARANTYSNVHVKCIDETVSYDFKILCQKTIGDLIVLVKKTFGNRSPIFLLVNDHIVQDLCVVDHDRILSSFGITDGQTIHITFDDNMILDKQASYPLDSDKISTSSDSTSKIDSDDSILVICEFPLDEPETFAVSTKETVRTLIKTIDNHKSSRPLAISRIYSDDIEIDFTNNVILSLNLTDLGLQSESIIHVIMEKKNGKSRSLVAQSYIENESPKTTDNMYFHLKPLGLEKIDNYPCMNSVLQCLVHIEPLTLQLIAHLSNWNTLNFVGEVTRSYLEFLQNLCIHNNDNSGYTSINAHSILNTLCTADENVASSDRHDAGKFLTYFLSRIDQELGICSGNAGNTIIKQCFVGEQSLITTCESCQEVLLTTYPFLIASIPFVRQDRRFTIRFLSKQTTCSQLTVNVPALGEISHVVAAFAAAYHRSSLYNYIIPSCSGKNLEFTTPLQNVTDDTLIFVEKEDRSRNRQPRYVRTSEKILTIEDLLEKYMTVPPTDVSWTCPKENCGMTTANKRFIISKLPNVLVIHFQRFIYEHESHEKIETFVDFPLRGLDLRKLVSPKDEDSIYDLVATINHTGSYLDGHYVAYGQNSDSKDYIWYRFDDLSVTRVADENIVTDIVTQDAHILFYIKKTIRPSETWV